MQQIFKACISYAIFEALEADWRLATANKWMIPELKRLIENPD